MKPLSLSKYHALGNDYLVLDPRREPDAKLTPERIRQICHRNFGAGSDGILYGPLPGQGGMRRLVIYNPDGSEAEKSGNGVRIFARYLRDRGDVSGAFDLETRGGIVHVEFLADHEIRVDMGTATFSREKEKLTAGDRSFEIVCVSVGNPHCVVVLPEISAELAHRYGPLIENHPSFPNRTNVQFMRVLARDRIRIEIWERGAGYTLASGSSSCAAASAAQRLGLADARVTVEMPGGEIRIETNSAGKVLMTGTTSYVAEIEYYGQ